MNSACTFVGSCLAAENVKAHIEAGVVEEIIGWLG